MTMRARLSELVSRIWGRRPEPKRAPFNPEPGDIVQIDGRLSRAQVDELSRQWEAAYTGPDPSALKFKPDFVRGLRDVVAARAAQRRRSETEMG